MKEELRIVPYRPDHAQPWYDLNAAWIEENFHLEEGDRQMLLHPRQTIVDRGGAILIAELGDAVVGTCALLPSEDPDYDAELIKMSVDTRIRGKGIGYRIGKAMLQLALRESMPRVFLESNRKLQPALHLYRKLGFREIPVREAAFTRADIMLAIDLRAVPLPAVIA